MISNTLMYCFSTLQWHRLSMFSAVILTLVGSTMIYIHSGGFIFGSPGETHMWFGFATVVLAVLQPIGAFFRPHPGTSRRSIFNWLHWLAGNSAHILSSEHSNFNVFLYVFILLIISIQSLKFISTYF